MIWTTLATKTDVLQLISGAWMKTHQDSFIPFIEGMTVDQYCGSHIEPYAMEMDNIGLQACFEAILRPAGVALQVLYLDRSPGEQVNELNWQLEPSDPSSTYSGTPTVRLLYRPYDLVPLKIDKSFADDLQRSLRYPLQGRRYRGTAHSSDKPSNEIFVGSCLHALRQSLLRPPART